MADNGTTSGLTREVELLRLGEAWDAGSPIAVGDGGIVRPVIIEEDTLREDQDYGRRCNPSTNPAAASRPDRAPHKVGRAAIRKAYDAGLQELETAYPGLTKLADRDGYWLTVPSKILAAEPEKTTFYIGVPFSSQCGPLAWAYRSTHNSVDWVGARHTNFPDGSICAFGPNDNTWSIDDGLTSLVDIFSEWAAKAYYFDEFRRWPGEQHGDHPYYRLKEFQKGKLCSCDNGKLYWDCCRSRDLRIGLISRTHFIQKFGCDVHERRPPSAVEMFAQGEACLLPRLADVYVGCKL